MGKLSTAAILLIAVNLGFLAAGVMLIKFTIDLNSTGWIDALEETEYKSTMSTMLTSVQILGYSTVVLSLVGILGAFMRSRTLLMIYSVAMIAAMIVFGVIGGSAFSFKGKVGTWKDGAYPADESEPEFAGKFNEIYCYAQGAYFCNNATTSDIVKIFLPDVPPEVASLLPQLQGINSLCSKDVSVVPGMDGVCKACSQAAKIAKFHKVLEWADEKCPRTAGTSVYCAKFLQSGTIGAAYDNSPYKECRGRFLELAEEWSMNLAIMAVVAALAAALLLALSCFARRSRHSDDDDIAMLK